MTEYTASRLTEDNKLFPDTIQLSDTGVTYFKRHGLRTEELNIPFDRVASVRVDKGVVWADLTIRSTGEDTIAVNGFSKDDADAIRTWIESRIAK